MTLSSKRSSFKEEEGSLVKYKEINVEPSSERLNKDALRVLNNPFWPTGLSVDEQYLRLHDDHDGTREGRMIVGFTRDGDAWLSTDQHRGPVLRFRTMIGGGRSLRVRNALVLLALAIKLDNEALPD